MAKIAWCKSHYKTDFCKTKAKELREQGYKVSLGSYIKENGVSYCKIYLEKNLNYYVLCALETMKCRIKTGDDPVQAILKEKETIRQICIDFATPIRVEFDRYHEEIVAVIDNKYELKKSLK